MAQDDRSTSNKRLRGSAESPPEAPALLQLEPSRWQRSLVPYEHADELAELLDNGGSLSDERGWANGTTLVDRNCRVYQLESDGEGYAAVPIADSITAGDLRSMMHKNLAALGRSRRGYDDDTSDLDGPALLAATVKYARGLPMMRGGMSWLGYVLIAALLLLALVPGWIILRLL